jgi:ATP-dependent DNA helicase RecG
MKALRNLQSMRCIKTGENAARLIKQDTMRPERLNPLFVPADSLKGVGPGLARPLEKLGLTRVRDLAYHLPDRFVERRAVADLDAASVGENIIVALTPRRTSQSAGGARFRVLASDAIGNICRDHLFRARSYGRKSSLPSARSAGWRAARPVRADAPDRPSRSCERDSAAWSGNCEPVYGLSEGLTQPRSRRWSQQALAQLPELPEWIEPGLLSDKMHGRLARRPDAGAPGEHPLRATGWPMTNCSPTAWP